mgnify:CR=1 FL=1
MEAGAGAPDLNSSVVVYAWGRNWISLRLKLTV